MKFSSINRKKVEGHFTGGSITSDGGLSKRMSRAIQDKRHPSYVDHSIFNLLKQRIYAIAAGYEDINDHEMLRQDSCFQLKLLKIGAIILKNTRRIRVLYSSHYAHQPVFSSIIKRLVPL